MKSFSSLSLSASLIGFTLCLSGCRVMGICANPAQCEQDEAVYKKQAPVAKNAKSGLPTNSTTNQKSPLPLPSPISTSSKASKIPVKKKKTGTTQPTADQVCGKSELLGTWTASESDEALVFSPNCNFSLSTKPLCSSSGSFDIESEKGQPTSITETTTLTIAVAIGDTKNSQCLSQGSYSCSYKLNPTDDNCQLELNCSTNADNKSADVMIRNQQCYLKTAE